MVPTSRGDSDHSETEQHCALGSHQRVVDERVQQDQYQTAPDEHALAARRSKQPVVAVFERSL